MFAMARFGVTMPGFVHALVDRPSSHRRAAPPDGIGPAEVRHTPMGRLL